MDFTNNNQDAYNRCVFYIKNFIGYQGNIDLENLCLRSDPLGITVSTWNTAIFQEVPTWSVIDTFWDSVPKYPDGVFPLKVTGNNEQTLLLSYTVTAGSVLFSFDDFSEDLKTPSTFTSSIPLKVSPKNNLSFNVLGTNNSVRCQCYLKIFSNGDIKLFSDINGGSFTGNSGMDGTSINYNI